MSVGQWYMRGRLRNISVIKQAHMKHIYIHMFYIHTTENSRTIMWNARIDTWNAFTHTYIWNACTDTCNTFTHSYMITHITLMQVKWTHTHLHTSTCEIRVSVKLLLCSLYTTLYGHNEAWVVIGLYSYHFTPRLFTWNEWTMQLKKIISCIENILSELFFMWHMDLNQQFFSKWLSLATWLRSPLHSCCWIILLKLWAFCWNEDQVWKAWECETTEIWFYSLGHWRLFCSWHSWLAEQE